MKKLESRSECATDERLRKKANRNLASSSRPQKLPSHLATKLFTPHSLFLVYFPFSLPSHSHKSWSLSLIRFCASPFPCRVETMTIFRCLNPPKCLHTHTETQENTKTTVLTQYTLHMYYSRENLRSFLVCVYGTEERKRRINGKLVGRGSMDFALLGAALYILRRCFQSRIVSHVHFTASVLESTNSSSIGVCVKSKHAMICRPAYQLPPVV